MSSHRRVPGRAAIPRRGLVTWPPPPTPPRRGCGGTGLGRARPGRNVALVRRGRPAAGRLLEEALRAQGPEPTALRARLLAPAGRRARRAADPSAPRLERRRGRCRPRRVTRHAGRLPRARATRPSGTGQLRRATAVGAGHRRSSRAGKARQNWRDQGMSGPLTAAAEHVTAGLDRELAAYSALAVSWAAAAPWYAPTARQARASRGRLRRRREARRPGSELGTRLGAPEAERLNVVTPDVARAGFSRRPKGLEQDLQQDRGRLPADNPLLCCWTATTAALNLGGGTSEGSGAAGLAAAPGGTRAAARPVVAAPAREPWLGRRRLRDAERDGALLELLRPTRPGRPVRRGGVFWGGRRRLGVSRTRPTRSRCRVLPPERARPPPTHGRRPWTARTQCELAAARDAPGTGRPRRSRGTRRTGPGNAEGLDMRTLAADLSALG